MNLAFRKLDETNPQDVEQFNHLMGELLEQADSTEVLKGKIRKANALDNQFLLAVEDTDYSKICGSLLAVTFDDFCGDCSSIMVIENVIIHHEYQGKGIGRKMFEVIEEWGKTQNVNYTILCSSLEREGAHKFYHAIGYEEVKGFKKFLK